MPTKILDIIPPLIERGLYCNHLVCPSVSQYVHLSTRSHFRNKYLSFYWKKWFYIWYMALAWWLVPYLPFPCLPHIYFLFTVRLRIFHVCHNENFCNRYLSFYGRNDFIFDIWLWHSDLYTCLPFPGLPHIYFLFTVRLGIFHVCRNKNFCKRYFSFYWKKWYYIWYMAFAWWIVPCLPFPGYFLVMSVEIYTYLTQMNVWGYS